MDYAIVIIAALIVSGLALFSGFGLGTLLMPVFALFFPLEAAIAATAVVHLANNLFRVGLVGRGANLRTAALFGFPAAAMAVVGALLLTQLTDLPTIGGYSIGSVEADVTVAKLVIGLLILGFALFDLLPSLADRRLERKYLPLGGALSGFFGGLSGHQGALRSAFLSATGIGTAEFIGTAALAALVVDLSRLTVYGVAFYSADFSATFGEGGVGLVAAATAAAFVGTFTGSRFIESVTIEQVRIVVGALLLFVSAGLVSGLI